MYNPSIGTVTGYHVDVSNPEQVKETAARVLSDKGGFDVLINNAGIVVGKYFHEHTIDEIQRSMDCFKNLEDQTKDLFSVYEVWGQAPGWLSGNTMGSGMFPVINLPELIIDKKQKDDHKAYKQAKG